MTVGWVAAATRGRGLARHLVGTDRARVLVGRDWPGARRELPATMYGADLAPDASRDDARRVACQATAWQLRLLAGWLPPGQRSLVGLAAAPLEIADIDGHIASLAGGPAGPPIRLGSLAAAWPRVAATRSPEAARAVLASSVWGDPGGVDRASIAVGLRLAWARRLARRSAVPETWARGGAVVIVARERFGFARPLSDTTARVADGLLGPRWRDATDLAGLQRHLPGSASWPLAGVEDPSELWRAESALIGRVDAEASRLASASRPGRGVVVGVLALLLVDLVRVLAVIDLAGRGPDAVEVFDAVV